ncbi:MAG: tRNA (adenosine(37)-N6)-threonylcarbamoyltransferase complex ATPase subunit type 1 TsaE [Gammaproteobacteria bacterium]
MTRFYAADVAAMDVLGVALAGALREARAVVYLKGELGAGKTTLVRGVARGLGIEGRVRSPTYTLVEGYELPDGMLYHLDLYRLSGAGELEFLGIRELDAPDNRVFIEWPERVAEGTLPAADLVLSLAMEGEGRAISAQALTPRGQQLAADWQALFARTAKPDSELLL